MEYIIIIDNNEQDALVLRSLLRSESSKRNLTNYKIGVWSKSVAENFGEAADDFCDEINTYPIEENAKIHLLIDLLLTSEEEETVGNISDSLKHTFDGELKIATGIKLANELLMRIGERIEISFMSKWVNLHSGTPITEYNGIFNNAQWQHKTVKSVLNPMSENHNIINRKLSVAINGAKTIVDAFCNVAFGLGE